MGISLIPLNYRTRGYTSFPNGFLLSNAGQRNSDQVRILMTFDFESSSDESVQVHSENSFKAIGFNWGDKGFVIGDSVSISYTINSGSSTGTFSGVARTIIDIQGDVVVFNNNIVPLSTFVGSLMPMSAGSDSNSTLEIDNLTRSLPEQIEYFHNIINNSSSPNKNSLIDGEQNRFLANDVDSMVAGDSVNMIQVGNKSGGSYIFAELTRVADTASGQKNFQILVEYYTPWKFESDDFTKPTYLTGQQSLKPTYFVKAFPEQNNPNAGLAIKGYGFNLGNVGWYGESYNGNEDDFTLTALTITDSSGQVINEIDHNQTCTVSGTITGVAPVRDFIEVEFYIIPPQSEYKNNQYSNAQNIFLANFTAEVAGVIENDSYGKLNGAVSTSNESITSLSGNTMSFSFQIQPNTGFTDYIDGLQDQQRLYRMSLNLESEGGTNNENDGVSKILKEGILTAAPTPDQPYEDVSFSGFFNHWQDIDTGVSELIYKGTTEDDFVYKTKFNLEKSIEWERMTTSVEVVKNSDGTSFVLDQKTFNFDSFIMDNDGVIQFTGSASSQFLQQYLDAPERNKIQIKNTGTTTATTYEVQLNWSLMANWRYWEPQINAFLDFYDNSLPNNGQNKEWVRYLQLSGYSLKVYSRLIKDGVAYFWENNIDLDDYDDAQPTITSLDPVYIDSNSNIQTVLISGQDMIVRADHVLSSGSWDTNNTAGWIAERGFEDDPSKRISTKWNWTSQNTPLKPKTGQTKAELTFPSPDVARVECVVQTNLVDIDNVSFVSRIKSPQDPACQHPIDYVFDYIESIINNDSEIITVYNQLLNKVVATETNICCPTCTGLFGSPIFGQTTIFAIGSNSDIQSLIQSASSEGSVCCESIYKQESAYTGCIESFSSDFDTLAFGNAAALAEITNAYTPTILNSYTGVNEITKLHDRLEQLTSDVSIRLTLLEEIISRGLLMRCDANGNKYLTRY